MKGVAFYYGEFERIIRNSDEKLADSFVEFYQDHKPNEVYLWLYEKKNMGLIPNEVESYMADFFWEVR